MKTLLLLLIFLPIASNAALFHRAPKETPEQKRIKASHFPVVCKECRKGFIGHPTAVQSTGGHATTNGTVQEWTLTFKCPKCKEPITALHESLTEPRQVVAPIPVPAPARKRAPAVIPEKPPLIQSPE